MESGMDTEALTKAAEELAQQRFLEANLGSLGSWKEQSLFDWSSSVPVNRQNGPL